ncbi:hypothetical protein [Yersinia intermedia]|uniref:hypothetical protein n=1 Tax=Yersinia intermedia TaxID=631 RepID=UPI0005E03D14|nr:hypothetical protein [Yersinia intermedia]CNI50715.1 Uncharacterised protein [Yersinia intermedia]
MLLNEIETVQEEAKESVDKRAKERAQVFFIGEQSADSPEIFNVTDYRLICAIVGHITYP